MDNILNNISFKKFLHLKKLPFNKLLQNLYEHDINLIENDDDKIDTCYFFIFYFYENLNNSINFLQINKTNVIKTNIIKTRIIKENVTNTYFFISNQFLFFYINQKDIKNFYLKFFFSDIYKFKIYKYGNNFICFCISHKKNNLPEKFYEEYSLKSLFLSHILNNIFKENEIENNCSFIILNNSYNNYINKINNTFQLYSVLGNGPLNNDSLLFIETIKEYIKYYKYTPFHYLTTF